MANGSVVVLTRTLYTVKDDQLQKMGPRVERAVQDAVYKLGRETRDVARSYCPKRTGALMASIYVTRPGGAPKGGAPFTRQTTTGYFRAMTSAARLRPSRLGAIDDALVHPKTQRPTKHSVAEGVFSSAVEKIRGVSYRTYSGYTPGAASGTAEEVEGELHLTPSLTEMGHAGRSSFFVTVGASAYYAGFVEFGHVGRGGVWVESQPFMTPALNWAKSRLPDVIRRAVEEGVRR